MLLLSLVVAALGCAAGGALGETTLPPGPRLSFVEAEYPPAKEGRSTAPNRQPGLLARIVTVDADGRARRVLIGPPSVSLAPIGAPAWSGDGGEIAFAAEAGPESLGIYRADADGTGIRAIPAAGHATRPVLSPDGRWVAFERIRTHTPKIDPKDPLKSLAHFYLSSTAWIASVDGGRAHRLTPWGNGRFATPTSFSPDGSLLAVTVDTRHKPEAVDLVDVVSGKTRRVEAEAGEAAFSPDGSQIAFSSNRDHESAPGFDGPVAMAELYVSNADFSGAHRVTRTPELAESLPSWDPGGDRLAFLRTPDGEDFLGLEGEVVEANVDGTCTKAIAMPKARRKGANPSLQAPAWVPGPGRAAGPISC